MFKLPVLQPHLTGNHGVEGRTGSASRYSPLNFTRQLDSSGPDGPLPGLATGMEIKDWEGQARDVMTDITSSDKYKSLALHSEVKLSEALERCSRMCPTVLSEDGEETPSKLKTAVVLQLLGEFSSLCGPFSLVLRTIRDELLRSLYSPLFSSEKGLLVFDQLPWFSVAARLEEEKVIMEEQRTRFMVMLDEQQDMIARIEAQVVTYQHNMQVAQLEAAGLRGRVDSLAVNEEAARSEARTGREELKKLRKEWLRMRDEVEAERESHRKFRATSEQEASAQRAEAAGLTDAMQRLGEDLDDARAMAAFLIPPDSVDILQAQVDTLKREAVVSVARVKKLEAAALGAEARLGTMTPRPSWHALRSHGLVEGAGIRTQDLVALVAEKLAACGAQADAAAAQVAELEQVLVDEPPAREVTLAIATESSAYFITEGAQQEGSSSQVVSAEGLGMGPHVPRCLRRRAGRMVEGLPSLTLEQSETLAADIWRAKQVHDAVHQPQPLHIFLYSYLSAAASATSQGASAWAGGGGKAGGGTTTSAANLSHHTITQQAYALYYAMSRHERASPSVALFRRVLCGQLPETAHTQQRAMFLCVLTAAQQAAKLATEMAQQAAQAAAERAAAGEEPEATDGQVPSKTGVPVVPTSALLLALDRLCSGLPSFKVTRVKDAYLQSVAPVSIRLRELQVLLLPLVLGADAMAVAEVQANHLQASALAAQEDEAAVAEEGRLASSAADAELASAASGRLSSARSPLSPSLFKRSSVMAPQPARQASPARGIGAAAGAVRRPGQQPLSLQELVSKLPDVSASYGNPFVAMLMQLHLEAEELGVTALRQRLGALPGLAEVPGYEAVAGAPRTTARRASPNLTASLSLDQSATVLVPAVVEALGPCVAVPTLVQALAAALAPGGASETVAGVESGSSLNLNSKLSVDWLEQQAMMAVATALGLPLAATTCMNKVECDMLGQGQMFASAAWSGLCTSKLLAQCTIRPAGSFPNCQAMLLNTA